MTNRRDPVLDRVAELERSLRRIADEVRGAGVLGTINAIPAGSFYRKLGALTDREREILNRLLRGERVALIAEGLFIGRSTVRNHLSTIFKKFSVHSQAELIELLRPELDADDYRSSLSADLSRTYSRSSRFTLHE